MFNPYFAQNYTMQNPLINQSITQINNGFLPFGAPVGA